MWPVLAALLLAGPVKQPPVKVVVSGAHGDSGRLAEVVASAIDDVGLRADAVELSGYFEARPEGCGDELKCLCGAPALRGIAKVLVLRSSSLERNLHAVDLRMIDCSQATQRARISEVVDAAGLVAWFEKAARRAVLAAD